MRKHSLEKYLRLGEHDLQITSIIFLILLVLITSTVADAAKPTKYTVTATAGPNGTITPSSRKVNSGTRTTFYVTPNTGYQATMGGTCPIGSPTTWTSPFTYTTGIITANCTLTATFAKIPVNGACGSSNGGTFTTAPTTNFCSAGTASALSGKGPWTWSCAGLNGGTTANCSANIETWNVTPSAGPEGSISPNTQQTVNHGLAASFTVTPGMGYTATVGGTCGGSPVEGVSQFTYTTNPVTADCTVTVTFTLKSLTATASAGPGGIINPDMQPVNYGSATSFTVTPNGGYTATVGGTCGGSPTSSNASPFIYTTNQVISDCTVSVAFTLSAVDGKCGLSNGQVFMTAPTSNLCSAGTESAVSGSGPWSWSCTGLNGGATANCSAQYQKDLPVKRLSGNNEFWHTSIQDAYDAASSGDEILTLDSGALPYYAEDLIFDRDGVSVTIRGGFRLDFHLMTGVTLVKGSVTITAGEVIFDNVDILPSL